MHVMTGGSTKGDSISKLYNNRTYMHDQSFIHRNTRVNT